MKRILIIQAAAGPDYLADLVTHYLYFANEKFILYTNNHPEYLFDDYPQDQHLSGNGFTVYRKIPHTQKNYMLKVSHDNIMNGLKNSKYDIIVWTSVRRCADFLGVALDLGYKKEQLIALDGEDDTNSIMFPNGELFSSRITYYKRELTDDRALSISFKFPSCHPILNGDEVKKSRLLAPCDPRFRSSYIQSVKETGVNYTYTTEETYYQQYQESLFAFTTKKSGWDCMRHYEILAANCLPVFPEISTIPAMTMTEWDRDLQLRVNALWLEMSNVNRRIDIELYMPIWKELMSQFKNLFNTKMKTEHYQTIFNI